MFDENEIRTNDAIFELVRLINRMETLEDEMNSQKDLSLRATQNRSFKRLNDKRYSMLITLKALIYAEIEAEEIE